MKLLPLIGLVCAWFISPVLAQTKNNSANWLDNSHQSVQTTLQSNADKMNRWFGTPKENQPASAELRILIDNYWNKYEGYSIKPRLRGKIQLPTLRERIHLVFGDEDIDDELNSGGNIAPKVGKVTTQAKRFDTQQTRRDNSSVGLQWLLPKPDDQIQFKLGLGARSNGDLYTKIKADKVWYYGSSYRARATVLYRYGIKSEHYVQNSLELNYAPTDQVVNSQQINLTYRHHDGEENWTWDDTVSRKHFFADQSWFSYGVYLGGKIADAGDFTLDTYGPFVSLRSNIYRNWLFIQPEITYYNNKDAGREHHLATMIRLEAQF